MSPPFRLAFVLATVLAVAGSAGAQEPAGATGTVPYATLYQTLKPARDAALHPHLRIVPHITSHIPGVRPETIKLVVQAASGPRPVVVAPDGAIAFPLEDSLLQENPIVTTNQPRGSLSLGVTLEIAVPRQPRWTCADILSALAEAEPVIASMPPRDPQAPHVRGLELFFSAGKDARVVVRGRGERLLQADDDGRIVLMRDAELSEPGAEIEFSSPPARAQPYLGQ